MVGLGETDDEIVAVLRDLRAHGVDIVTLGQYLRPTREPPARRPLRAARGVRAPGRARARDSASRPSTRASSCARRSTRPRSSTAAAGPSALTRACRACRLAGDALAALSGVLLALSFPKFGHGRVAWVALAPLLVALAGAPQGARGRSACGYVTGAVSSVGLLYWTALVVVQYGGLPPARGRCSS